MAEDATVGVVFARGGSKGIPRKNLQVIAGLTLLARAIQAAKNCGVDICVVSTDDDEIAGEAESVGATVWRRPPHLCRDNSAEFDSWKFVATEILSRFGDRSILLSVPTTSPLRRQSDVDHCLRKLKETAGADLAVCVSQASRHPMFNLLTTDDSGFLRTYQASTVVRRQDLPQAWDLSTVAYAARCEWICKAKSIWDGRMCFHEVPALSALDLDEQVDLDVARLVFESGYVIRD